LGFVVEVRPCGPQPRLVLVLLAMAESMVFHRLWIDALIFALALAVGVTPELLPMIMTITLAPIQRLETILPPAHPEI
jgi:hypothetical protein